MRENLSLGVCHNKGADQPAHPCILTSAFVIHLLETIISRLATSKISLFQLISVAEQAGLSCALLETPVPEDKLCPVEAHMTSLFCGVRMSCGLTGKYNS